MIGCASSPAAAPSCSVQFGGNTGDAAKLPDACASLESAADAGGDGGLVLNLQASTAKVSALDISIALGEAPAPGSYSSEMRGAWNAVGAFESSAACMFSAGDGLVPSGSYTLTLSEIRAADGGDAHGTLELTAFVHAPPGIDCGPGDTEQVRLEF